jgi:hypothetical protein
VLSGRSWSLAAAAPPRIGGLAGDQLVPDLATALPRPSDGGKTYTFRLRARVRYSTGALVRPDDGLDGTMSEVNPGAGQQVAAIPVGIGPNAITSGYGSVWVANMTDDNLGAQLLQPGYLGLSERLIREVGECRPVRPRARDRRR